MKNKLSLIIIVLLFLCGIAVFLYPTVSNYLYEKNSTRAIIEYTEKLSEMSPELIEEEKQAVREYNKNLHNDSVVITDPFDPNAVFVDDEEYNKRLSFDDIMATLEIPAINVNLPIYHGTEETVLQKGVGHLNKSSLPLGGESTHVVLSAHCGLPSARLFTDLNLLKEGNIFRIYVLDEVLTYQVFNIEVVEPNDSSSLVIRYGEDIASLITCTPYGVNTHRLIVHGKRIDEAQAEIIEEPAKVESKSWEYYANIIAMSVTILFVLMLLIILIKKLAGKRKHEKNS
ncbi:MAG: class C sortase [Clostridia bacterium]|nr:class C sortase [Clostridia bacterium]